MTINIIGTGKVAWQLSQGLSDKGHTILHIIGRNKSAAVRLANKFKASHSIKLSTLNLEADLTLIAISDDAIEEVCQKIPNSYKGIISHTSGAKDQSVIPYWCEKKGIFYPLYSFNSRRKISLKKVPILVTSINDQVKIELLRLAKSLTSRVYEVNDEERANLHLAAVFANNFGNFMMTLGFERLKRFNIDDEILLPIIKQSTANWAKGISKEIQTGPAVRGDLTTIDKHIELIQDKKLKNLYRMISNQIKTFYT